jgi:hypothetical protein
VTDGVLINAGGTIVSIVFGFVGSAPAGQTFAPLAEAAAFHAGQSSVSVFVASAQAALDISDTTVYRITEAVALGDTTWTASDVVAFVHYRRALRALLTSTTVGVLPTRPAYPAGT